MSPVQNVNDVPVPSPQQVWFPCRARSAGIAFAVAVVLGSALRAGTGPQRWEAEDAQRLQRGRRLPPGGLALLEGLNQSD